MTNVKEELGKEVAALRAWLNDNEYNENVSDARWNAKRAEYFELKRKWLKYAK